MRILTTNTTGRSAGLEAACGGRNRGRRRRGVVSVNRRWRRDVGAPGSVARRGRRGRRGEASCGSDLAMACWNSGYPAAKLEHGAAMARVCFCGRNGARARGKSEAAGRGVRPGAYPLAGRPRLDGNGVRRGWRSTARSLQAPGKTTEILFQVTPWNFCFLLFGSFFHFYFLFII